MGHAAVKDAAGVPVGAAADVDGAVQQYGRPTADLQPSSFNKRCGLCVSNPIRLSRALQARQMRNTCFAHSMGPWTLHEALKPVLSFV